MTRIILITITLCSIFIFPLITQPLRLGLRIILSTLFICIITAILISSWYAYILFLIYVGGLLVIFAYVATLSPNTLFINTNAIFFYAVLITPFIYIFYIYNFTDSATLQEINSWIEFIKSKKYGTELIAASHISILISLRLILLLNLIVVVNICYYKQGSLRPYKKQYA